MICRSEKYLYYLLFFLLFPACSDYSPKPAGYFRIDLIDPVYSSMDTFASFRLAVSNQARIVLLPSDNNDFFFNIDYPALNAQIYCSYFPLTEGKLAQFSEESRTFAYRHVIKAEAIQERTYENPAQKVYGLIYSMKGNVASPVQFVLTDSVHSFFRGALYFNHTPNQDSIAPVLEHINRDINVLIENFQWKK
ncbi:hypothetical protein AGMMS50262_13910 [Bacteroidia bacterium]|nr:hypothetical protein AGMMS50262_13910 [Bacteroidia bacterium]